MKLIKTMILSKKLELYSYRVYSSSLTRRRWHYGPVALSLMKETITTMTNPTKYVWWKQDGWWKGTASTWRQDPSQQSSILGTSYLKPDIHIQTCYRPFKNIHNQAMTLAIQEQVKICRQIISHYDREPSYAYTHKMKTVMWNGQWQYNRQQWKHYCTCHWKRKKWSKQKIIGNNLGAKLKINMQNEAAAMLKQTYHTCYGRIACKAPRFTY